MLVLDNHERTNNNIVSPLCTVTRTVLSIALRKAILHNRATQLCFRLSRHLVSLLHSFFFWYAEKFRIASHFERAVSRLTPRPLPNLTKLTNPTTLSAVP